MVRKWFGVGVFTLVLLGGLTASGRELAQDFREPPAAARPWVYWFFLDGNLSREGITADLEAMQQAGIGGVILMEVDAGIPKGPVQFMSEPWLALFKHAVSEAQRLGLEITLNAGPGWTGSGGPWVKPEQSMQHIVASETEGHGRAAIRGGPAAATASATLFRTCPARVGVAAERVLPGRGRVGLSDAGRRGSHRRFG